ncbi:MAG: DUF5916 domain-containing protein [Armatimonadota bacterium]
MNISARGIILILLISTLLLQVCAYAERPVIQAVKVDIPPVIDGDISDACWQQVPKYSDFFLPNDRTKAPEETIVWLCYDQKNIYAGFHCKDSQPDKIVSEQKKRGGNMGNDDRIEIDIDCFNSFNWDQIPWLQASAGGVQRENLQSGNVSKIEWKGDWTAASKRVSDGYTVEFSVPFSVLQYDSKCKKMGIMFARYHSRTSKWWASPDIGSNWDPRQFCVWDGLELPVSKRKPLILGYSLSGAGKDKYPNKIGLDIKHSFSPRFTGVMTINPDFRNIEQQVDSIDFSYNERYLSDNRPFFQEGSQYFPGSEIFYTRRIEEIDYGAKFLGKMGAYNMGIMRSSSPDNRNATVMKLSRDLNGKGNLVFAGVQSGVPGRDNLATQFSGDYRIYEKGDKRLTAYSLIGSADSMTGIGSGQRFESGLYYGGGPNKWGWSVSNRVVDKDYDPALGLFPEKDLRGWSADISLYKEPKKGKIQNWYIGFNGNTTDHKDGSLYYNGLGFNGSVSSRKGTGVYFGTSASERPPYNDHGSYIGCWWGGKTLYRSGDAGFSFGKTAGGKHVSWSIGQGWDLSDKMNIRSSYESSTIKQPSPSAFSLNQWISTLSYDLDDERTISGRLVARSGKSNLYFGYRQRVRSGLDAYVTIGDPNADSTKSSLTVKLVRPL